MTLRKHLPVLILALLLLAGTFHSVLAQTGEPYRVSLRRDFGYGSGADIQGNMTLRLVGEDADITRVTFLMDDQTLIVLESTPYQFQFTTDDFAPGQHHLAAQVETKDGLMITTKAITYRFLSAEEANSGIKSILIPILGVVAIAYIGSMLVQTRFDRKIGPMQGQLVNCGALGGTICPRCGHPFSRTLLGINLVVGKLERCPACGKFVMTTRATPAQLAAAEASETAVIAESVEPMDLKNKETDQLEESKYIDSDR